MLSAGAAGTIGIDPQVLIADLHLDLLVNVRHDITGHKGGLTFSCRIERRNTHQTVHAFFRFQIPVSIHSVDLEGHRLHAGFLTLQKIQLFQSKAFALRPAGVHPVQHSAPVAGFRSARSRVQLDNRIVGIKFSGKECLDTDCFEILFKTIQHFLNLRNDRRVVFFVAHLDQRLHILFRGYKSLIRVPVILHAA